MTFEHLGSGLTPLLEVILRPQETFTFLGSATDESL